MSIHTNEIGITEELTTRKDIPEDYHCDCKYCTSNFIGEIYDIKNDKYYSQRCRNKYYDLSLPKHIAPGHFIGYRWSIHNLTKEGDSVLDPTIGTGTAVVEAINNNRNGLGIELEYPEIAKGNVDYQIKNGTAKGIGTIIHGNAKNLKKLIPKSCKYQLIINGTPYFSIRGKSADAPERKSLDYLEDNTFDYEKEENFGKKEGDEYWKLIINMYLDCIEYMEIGGYLVIAVKDLVRDKKSYLLHKEIIDRLLKETDQLEYHGCVIHKHIPTTMFINTYRKRFSEVKIPLYQTLIILKKIK